MRRQLGDKVIPQSQAMEGLPAADPPGCPVAAVLFALTHVGVVLLQDGLVAIILVLFVATGPDDPNIAPHVLVDLPADGVILAVRGTGLEILHGLGHGLVASPRGLVVERVAALGVGKGGALVAL